MRYFPLLILTLFLTSCAANLPTDKNNLKLVNKVSTEQEVRRAKILDDQVLQRLGKTDPDAYSLYQQAQVAEMKGELDIAIELYHKAMQQVPENGFLLTRLGMAYLRNEDIIPARRYLLKAVSFEPDYYKPRLGLGYIYLQNQQLQKAVTHLEASLKLLTTVEGSFLLAEAKQAQGNLLEAKQLYQSVVSADKKSKLGRAAAARLRSLSK